ncbi:hypothetical protein ACFL24_01730 [Patescibacteria group bacterium]
MKLVLVRGDNKNISLLSQSVFKKIEEEICNASELPRKEIISASEDIFYKDLITVFEEEEFVIEFRDSNLIDGSRLWVEIKGEFGQEKIIQIKVPLEIDLVNGDNTKPKVLFHRLEFEATITSQIFMIIEGGGIIPLRFLSRSLHLRK